MRPALAPRRVFLFLITLLAAGSLADPALAQDISINLGAGNGGVTERAIQLIALLTVLSIAPSILIMQNGSSRRRRCYKAARPRSCIRCQHQCHGS